MFEVEAVSADGTPPDLPVEEFSADMTLAEARPLLRLRANAGVTCPTCDQYAKVYRRRIYGRMAYDLIRLYRAGAAWEWVHLPTILNYNGGDSGKLRYWGLLQEETEIRRDDGGRAGWWQVTKLGVEFVFGRLSVPKYVLIYNSEARGLEGAQVTIHDCLGDKFDYRELMGWAS